MILPLTSVLAVLGCLVPQAEAGLLPVASNTLQYVFAVFRHGPRSPLHRYYPNHETTEIHLKTFTGLRGVLTAHGKEKMYEVGKYLRDRYGRFLGDYREDRVWVTSRGASRNVMTALTIMAGMMPPKQRIIADLDWQPIPPFSITDDKSHIFHDLEFKNLHECPKYEATAERFREEMLSKEEWKKPIYILLRAYTGNDHITSIASAYQVYDTLHSEYMNGIPLPSWALANQPSIRDLPLYPTLLREVVEEWKTDPVAKILLNLYIVPFFYGIKSKLRNKALDKDFDELMHFHVTEDSTLIGLLNLLQIKEPNAYEPGNGLIIELHYDDDLWYVQVNIYDSRPTPHNMYPVMPGFVKTEKFLLSTLLGVTLLPTWEEACGISKPPQQ